jgi:hypothetical protein
MLHGLHHQKKIKQNSGNSRIFPQKIILPFPSSHDLATQPAANLTHALLHPQPAGPFCQVGDEQTIALKRLASILVSAKPRNTNNPLAPQDGIENNAPQRVQNHSFTSQSSPDSHRRQKTPVRLIVTPQTPHVMV